MSENQPTDTKQTDIIAPTAPEPSKAEARRAIIPIDDGALAPTDLDGVWRIANMLASTPNMIPPSFKRPEEVCHAILFGLELGLSPLQSVQAVMVVNNRPTIWGDSAIALVRSRGRCVGIEESIDGEGDEMAAVCRAKRLHSIAGHGEEVETIERRFSVDDAKLAGLWGKAGPWKQYPKRMLQMRARSWALRDGFADVLRGVGIREEVDDFAFDPKRMAVSRADSKPVELPELPQDTRRVLPVNE